MFYTIRDSVNRIFRIIYCACIHSRVKYGIEVYGTDSNTKIRKLQTLQNKLLKVLTKSNYRHSTDKLHKDLDILKVKDLYKSSLHHFVYNCVKGSPINPFKNYFAHRSDQHDYNLRNNDDLNPLERPSRQPHRYQNHRKRGLKKSFYTELHVR